MTGRPGRPSTKCLNLNRPPFSTSSIIVPPLIFVPDGYFLSMLGFPYYVLFKAFKTNCKRISL
jgi:hypothetical protein